MTLAVVNRFYKKKSYNELETHFSLIRYRERILHAKVFACSLKFVLDLELFVLQRFVIWRDDFMESMGEKSRPDLFIRYMGIRYTES